MLHTHINPILYHNNMSDNVYYVKCKIQLTFPPIFSLCDWNHKFAAAAALCFQSSS
jgi:hypothetical protein